jgi:hypothetical protein
MTFVTVAWKTSRSARVTLSPILQLGVPLAWFVPIATLDVIVPVPARPVVVTRAISASLRPAARR